NRGRRRKTAKLEKQNGKDENDCERQHKQEITERALLLFVCPAVDDADGWRDMKCIHRPLYRRNSLPQAHAFEATRYGNIALQVFAANFGLTGFISNVRERAKRGSFPGRAGEKGISNLVERGPGSRREPHTHCVRAVIDDDRRWGGLALQNRAGVELNF